MIQDYVDLSSTSLMVLLRIYLGVFVLKDEHRQIIELLDKRLIVKYIGKNLYTPTALGCRIAIEYL